MPPKRILVVDDEDHVREIIQACLKDLGGWDVLEAASAQTGLAIATSEKPDAILLDIVMPDMDGMAFLTALRANPELVEIPVILLSIRTPWLQPSDYHQWRIQGAIAKPFDSVKLPKQVAQILGWDLSFGSD